MPPSPAAASDFFNSLLAYAYVRHFSKVEVITGVARRRRFSTDLKLAVVAELMQPGMSVSYIARRHGLSPSLVFRWS